MKRSLQGARMRLWPLALLILAGGGPILLAMLWPAVVRQEPSLIYRSIPLDVPPLSFKDEVGQSVGLARFRGRVVLLNVWATWCAPCREEMPALDRLQAKIGSADFEVIALSVDRAGLNAVETFFRSIGIRHLNRYIDESATTMHTLGVVGLPTTLLIDREGREVRRYVGAAAWDNKEYVQTIRKALAQREE